MNEVRKRIFHRNDPVDLASVIRVPDNIRSAIVKCRVIYAETVLSVNCSLYLARRPKTLKIVESSTIAYSDKKEDRSGLENLLRSRGTCDDIIIVKDGCVTDSSSANILFYDGETWFTPDTPLLKGTKRRMLIENGMVRERRIRLEDIFQFTEISLVNAMLEPGETRIPVDTVHIQV
jgi:4-amino-4-deoxychorismate lyase